jgi:sugar phosphate isomerase/epimerase
MKIGTGIYILRDLAQQDLAQTIHRIQEIGYDGVEMVGFFSKTPEEIKSFLTPGFSVVGNHVPLSEVERNGQEIFQAHKILGCQYITFAIGKKEWEDDISSNRLRDLETAAILCRNEGLVPLYHNHWYDAKLLSKLAKECPSLSFEPDIGWMVYAGADPVPFLKEYGKRCPVLHLKDIYSTNLSALPQDIVPVTEMDPASHYFAFRPTGYGIVNFPQLWPLFLACEPEWLVVDHDCAYGRDPYEDLRISLEFVKSLLTIHP